MYVIIISVCVYMCYDVQSTAVRLSLMDSIWQNMSQLLSQHSYPSHVTLVTIPTPHLPKHPFSVLIFIELESGEGFHLLGIYCSPVIDWETGLKGREGEGE